MRIRPMHRWQTYPLCAWRRKIGFKDMTLSAYRGIKQSPAWWARRLIRRMSLFLGLINPICEFFLQVLHNQHLLRSQHGNMKHIYEG
jgi:hypothetical protein